jgi:hypothetical protein
MNTKVSSFLGMYLSLQVVLWRRCIGRCVFPIKGKGKVITVVITIACRFVGSMEVKLHTCSRHLHKM